MEKDTIITLDDNSVYALIENTIIDDKEYFFAVKLENKFGRTNELIAFLENDLNLGVNDKIKGYLLDSENEKFLYY